MDRELLAQHADGLLVLSGCLNSEVSRQLSAGDDVKARETAGWYQEAFGKDFYFMEVQSHGIEEQSRVTEGTVRIARELGAPLCGTNDSHYVDAGHAKAHEALLCIQTGAAMSDPGRWRFSTEEFYLKSADEMRSVFKDLPEAYRNTLAVAERCDLELGFGQFHLPKYDVPAGFTLDSYLEHLAFEGLKRRYGASPADAVVESGLGTIVYVERSEGVFEPRPVQTGWRFGGRVQIVSGLEPGTPIVVSGNALLDSQSRMRHGDTRLHD